MLGINDLAAPAALDQFIQPLLAFDEWQTPQILTIEPRQIGKRGRRARPCGTSARCKLGERHHLSRQSRLKAVEENGVSLRASYQRDFLRKSKDLKIIKATADEPARALLV